MKEKVFANEEQEVQKEILDYKKRKAINCAGFQKMIDWCCIKTVEKNETGEFE